ncbi:MAG: hypothetical protein K5860_01200 [Bacteroidales bacterium]|nr:hypothetical protein [Bacteroidales bacterium]
MKKIFFAFCTIVCIVGLQNNCDAQCECTSYTNCKQYAAAYRQEAQRLIYDADQRQAALGQYYQSMAEQCERCAQAYARNMSGAQRDQLDLQRQQLELQRQQNQQQQEMYRYYRYGY